MLLNHALEQLNVLPPERAAAEFLKCCGCRNWAQAMTGARPFLDVTDLLGKADSIWWSLQDADWHEAFRAHPKIGEQKAAATQTEQARTWSEQEQSGVKSAASQTKIALAAGNRQYEKRFG